MIIDFNIALRKKEQRNNKFRYFLIDALSPKEDDLDSFLDQLSEAGINTLSDFLDYYSEDEFFAKFNATDAEKTKISRSLQSMKLDFTG